MNHIVTPFSRPQNLPRLLPMILDTGAEWHPIDDPAPADWDGCYWKINQFLSGPLVDTDRYGFLADDDYYEPGFFQKLDQHKGEVVICSMLQGNHRSDLPPTPAKRVLAAPEFMHVNCCGLPQIFVSGRVGKLIRFENRCDADGRMIEYLVANYAIDYAPECWVWWNYLRPGRWDL